MSARVMTMDAAMDSGSYAPVTASREVRASWDGSESPWVLAALAAAPWPVWSLLAAAGVPGPSHVPPWLHGIFALALVFALMVLWTHRPGGRSTARWLPAVLGTGLMGELLADALTDMGRGGGLAGVDDVARAVTVGLICVAIYEVAPIVAANARLSRSERRHPSLDLLAYASFAALAAGAWAWDPVDRGWAGESLWRLSPWMAAAVAFPLAAARCAPRDAHLPSPRPRGGALWGLALIGWLLVAGLSAALWGELHEAVSDLRWGARPLEGLITVFPAVSLALSLGAAALLLGRAWLVRHAPRGEVAGLGDGGLTLERDGIDEPIWVALDGGPMPEEGARVTLLGVRRRAPDAGPFRDGAARWRARRAWTGDPGELARALSHRAAGWTLWAAASGLGVLFSLA